MVGWGGREGNLIYITLRARFVGGVWGVVFRII